MKTSLVDSWVVLVACLGYGIAAWLVQMYRVAPPRDWLLERIWFVRSQLASGRWGLGDAVDAELARVEAGVSKRWLFLPLSRVQAGWRNVHGVEDLHVLELGPALVDQALATAAKRMAAIPGPLAEDFGKRIDAALKTGAPPDARAALLREVEIFRHDTNDSTYENLANLLSKAVWLTWASLALVAALGGLFDRESFFLLGAAGGLISRLTRMLGQRVKASDYGAEWSTLVLSPAAGAVMGWVGVAVVTALAGDPFNVFATTFAKPWDDPTAPLGLVLAFAFGFSERLFDRLLGVAVGRIGAKLPKGTTEQAAAGGVPARAV